MNGKKNGPLKSSSVILFSFVLFRSFLRFRHPVDTQGSPLGSRKVISIFCRNEPMRLDDDLVKTRGTIAIRYQSNSSR